MSTAQTGKKLTTTNQDIATEATNHQPFTGGFVTTIIVVMLDDLNAAAVHLDPRTTGNQLEL
jgi:hypothetical protein